MRSIFIFLATFMVSSSSFAGGDTLYFYFDKDWKECKKEQAFFFGTAYKSGKYWERKDYWVEGNKLQMEGRYKKKDFKTPVGILIHYFQNGLKSSEVHYSDEGKIEQAKYYYENGKPKAEVTYIDGEQNAKGWDEAGNLIPEYIFEREAKFPGGLEGWQIFLENNLDSEVAAKTMSAKGAYRVVLDFIVTKEGDIESIQVKDNGNGCSACATEAIRVLSKSPKWSPAIQFNKPVKYFARQPITFQVQ